MFRITRIPSCRRPSSWWSARSSSTATASSTGTFSSPISRLGSSPTSTPSFLGRDLFIHKGLDLQGGTELTIEICHGFNNPAGSDCRSGPPNGSTLQEAQQATIPILDLRVNSLGVSEASVQAQGDDQILVQLPGVSAASRPSQTIGTTQKLYFANLGPGAPDPT